MHFLIIRITAFQPAGDLFRRLVLMHLLCNDFFTQCGLSINAGFGLRAFFPCSGIGFCCTVLFGTSVPLTSWLIVEGAFDGLAAMSLILSLLPLLWISPLFYQAKALINSPFSHGRTVAACLVDSGHNGRMISVEHSGDIM